MDISLRSLEFDFFYQSSLKNGGTLESELVIVRVVVRSWLGLASAMTDTISIRSKARILL